MRSSNFVSFSGCVRRLSRAGDRVSAFELPFLVTTTKCAPKRDGGGGGVGETDRQVQTPERGAKGLRGRWNSGGHRKILGVSAAVSLGGHPSQGLPVHQSAGAGSCHALRRFPGPHGDTLAQGLPDG